MLASQTRSYNNQRMKLRHAAALALVGWYLMIPPANPNGERDAFAPMIEWKVIDQFKSDRQCEGIRLQLIERMPLMEPARCIRSDDPRIQGVKVG
jgi:hypothetical protein